MSTGGQHIQIELSTGGQFVVVAEVVVVVVVVDVLVVKWQSNR